MDKSTIGSFLNRPISRRQTLDALAAGGLARALVLPLAVAALLGAATVPPRPHLPTTFPLVDPHGQAEALWFDGTLRLPAGTGPHPAVALLTGCTPLGSAGRDLAGHLQQAGYAVLSVSRLQQSVFVPICGAGEVNAVAEARGAVAHLRGNPLIDPARVAVIGVGAAEAAALALADEATSGLAPALSLAVPLAAPDQHDGGPAYLRVAGTGEAGFAPLFAPVAAADLGGAAEGVLAALDAGL